VFSFSQSQQVSQPQHFLIVGEMNLLQIIKHYSCSFSYLELVANDSGTNIITLEESLLNSLIFLHPLLLPPKSALLTQAFQIKG